MHLIVHSKSTKGFAEDYARKNSLQLVELVDVNTIKEPKPIENRIVVGIGGGKVIDYAKILAGNKPCIAIPTTAAGAASTSHAVYWDPKKKRKTNIKTQLPEVHIECEYVQTLTENMLHETLYDAMGHIFDSYWSKNATLDSTFFSRQAHKWLMNYIDKDENKRDNIDVVQIGNMAGKAIEITKTNMAHAISYPLTALYGISHGMAVGWALRPCHDWQHCDLELPPVDISLDGINEDDAFLETIVKEAMTYDKIHDGKKDITEKELKSLLEAYK